MNAAGLIRREISRTTEEGHPEPTDMLIYEPLYKELKEGPNGSINYDVVGFTPQDKSTMIGLKVHVVLEKDLLACSILFRDILLNKGFILYKEAKQ